MNGKREKILEFLDSFRQRKGMYISPVSAEEAEKFLYGFDVGCSACDVNFHWYLGAERRGWIVRTTTSPINVMRDKGLTEEQIIDELVAFRETALELSDK